jgi:hypothetical protein
VELIKSCDAQESNRIITMLVELERTREHFFSRANILHGVIVGAASLWCRTPLWALLMIDHDCHSSR